MTIELTPEQAAAVFWLAGSELQCIKADEVETGIAPDMNEVSVLLSLVNATNANRDEQIGWDQVLPAPLEDQESVGEEPPDTPPVAT